MGSANRAPCLMGSILQCSRRLLRQKRKLSKNPAYIRETVATWRCLWLLKREQRTLQSSNTTKICSLPTRMIKFQMWMVLLWSLLNLLQTKLKSVKTVKQKMNELLKWLSRQIARSAPKIVQSTQYILLTAFQQAK